MAAACFLTAFVLFITSASPTVSFEDTGELLVAARSLGCTHPPGYPWLTMLHQLAFHIVRAGDPAFRANVVSAACGAGAVAAVRSIGQLAAGPLAGWTAAAAFAVSRTLWWQAGIADKYTLSILLMLLAVRALLVGWRAGRASSLAVPAFLAGLALAHHLHGLYLIPVCLLAALARLRTDPGRTRRAVLLFTLAALPSLAKAVAIPIRSVADPAMNWGLPDTLGRLSFYLAARQYKFIMGANEGVGDVLGRLVRHLTVLPFAELGPLLALIVPGAWALWRRDRAVLAGAGFLLATNVWLAVTYNTPEIERYYLLSFSVLAVLIGAGATSLRDRPIFAGRLGGAALAGLLGAGLAWSAARHAAVSPRARHYLAWDFAWNQLAPLPPRALLICEGDDQAFPLFYAQAFHGVRPDVAIVPMPFACWEPSYRRMPAAFPGLVFPVFDKDPGRHLPRLMLANPDRPAFYTPGCTGQGSETHLLPRGAVFAAYADPRAHARAQGEFARLPALRLRGAVDAPRYDDAVTVRAVRNYGLAFAYHGAQALERGQAAQAARELGLAVRLPLAAPTRTAALTHLGLATCALGRLDAAEPLFRAAIALDGAFGPALFELGRLLLVRGRNAAEARELLVRAARSPRYLTTAERRDLARALGL